MFGNGEKAYCILPLIRITRKAGKTWEKHTKNKTARRLWRTPKAARTWEANIDFEE